MDTMWSFRSAYNEAKQIKAAQDLYCERAEAGLWDTLDYVFPENLQWEMLVDVLRGKVKVCRKPPGMITLLITILTMSDFQSLL